MQGWQKELRSDRKIDLKPQKKFGDWREVAYN